MSGKKPSVTPHFASLIAEHLPGSWEVVGQEESSYRYLVRDDSLTLGAAECRGEIKLFYSTAHWHSLETYGGVYSLENCDYDPPKPVTVSKEAGARFAADTIGDCLLPMAEICEDAISQHLMRNDYHGPTSTAMLRKLRAEQIEQLFSDLVDVRGEMAAVVVAYWALTNRNCPNFVDALRLLIKRIVYRRHRDPIFRKFWLED